MKKLLIFCLALGFVFAISGTVAFGGGKIKHGVPEYEVTEIENLAYGPYLPGNLLDLHLPDVPGNADLPLLIWHSGSAWFSNTAKDSPGAVTIAEEFTARGYAVATISIRSSIDARFPAQGHDVRAAIRWLRENACAPIQMRLATDVLPPKSLSAADLSELKEEVAKLLAAEGYVAGFEVAPGDPGKDLTVSLRYTEDRQRVLQGLRRISTPGRRLYSSASDLPRVQGGLGVTIVSTSQGLLVDRECRRRKLGGEIICEVW